MTTEQLSFSDSQRSDQREIKEYVGKFQKEIEKKYESSITNWNFRFPSKKKTIKKNLRHEVKSSQPSLEDVLVYDLKSVDVRREI